MGDLEIFHTLIDLNSFLNPQEEKVNCPCTFKLVVRHNQLSLPCETMPRIKIVKKNDLEIHIEMMHCTVLPRGPVVFATSFMFMSQSTCFLKTII